ncbi:MAG: hypothetical protein HZA82_05605 [Thaumarchaeota archaeon]|nr:hypothetical protein [Nitrososphaerota archaeon]
MSKLEFEKQKRLETNLILTCAVLVGTYIGIRYAEAQFILIPVGTIVAVLSCWLTLSIKKDGLGSMIITILGCATLISIIFIPSYMPATQSKFFPDGFVLEQISVEQIKENILVFKESMLYLTLFYFGMGLLLAYKPTIFYVRNRLPDESPYPVWNIKAATMTQFSPSLIALKSLLSEKERWIVFRYKFVLVSIDDKIYLVRPNDVVPENAMVLRSKSGQSLLGI